jgi:hypothetical protein
MNQRPPSPDDDVRLSEEEIQAMSQGLRRQYLPGEQRGVAGSVGKVVVNNFEALIKRLLLLFRLPLILLAGLAGFFILNGRDGVSFFVAVAAGFFTAAVGAALHSGMIRFIDMRAYRREVG